MERSIPHLLEIKMQPNNVLSFEAPGLEMKYKHLVDVLKQCGGFDLSTTDKISLIRQTLRDLGESPTITPMIPSRSP